MSGRYLPRGIDYLGILQAKLKDLRGFATLAYELIQNADDASATSMSFNICENEMSVENNGLFSDCGRVEDPICSWKDDPSKGHQCDFHRFRLVASTDKRAQIGTTGAFGIGFIAVYQITDRPELISAGRHWTLEEGRHENQRIYECAGCETCRAVPSGTYFRLPWARDPRSYLRRALRIEPISSTGPGTLLREIEAAVPGAMVFLKSLAQIDIKEGGRVRITLERGQEDDNILISNRSGDETIVHIWHLIHGSFEQEARRLRERNTDRIESKRTSKVVLAVPADPIDAGILYAYLPTQHETGLPFHVNADFFPTSDRKRIIFESDYQSDWNRAAIAEAAKTLAGKIEDLRSLLGHKRLWDTIDSVQKVARDAARGHKDESLGLFWENLSPKLGGSKVVFSAGGKWLTAAEVLLPLEREEEAAVPILEGLGISIVHADLRPYFGLLRGPDIGVQILDLPHITRALRDHGLSRRTEGSKLPKPLQSPEALRKLWAQLDLLLMRQRRTDVQRSFVQDLAACAIAPGRDGAIWPCKDLYRTDDETVALFGRINPQIPFLGELGGDGNSIKNLCPEFSAATAVEWLRRVPLGDLEVASADGRFHPGTLLHWFESRRDEVLRSPTLKRDLADLPVYPTSAGLRPLSVLALPGDFVDPLGLAEVVDVTRLDLRREFLRDLGAQELTFHAYTRDHVPRAFSESAVVSSEKKRAAVRILADRLGEIRDDQDAWAALTSALIVECDDGVFRTPGETYFKGSFIKELFGDTVPTALIPSEHQNAIREFYRWLGVAARPRLEDIMAQIAVLTNHPPSPDSVEGIQTVFSYLGQSFEKDETREDVDTLDGLKSVAWLPAKRQAGRWYRPQEVYADFRAYLFESQGLFLDLPRDVQISSAKLMGFLGIRTEPAMSQVVAHLLEWSKMGRPINREVYRFLNDNAQDSAILRLKDKACLLLPEDRYVRPDQVFWSDHPFGRFRYRLGHELRRYGDLFDCLGVRDHPDHRDAMSVLHEISSSFGNTNRPLDDGAYAVVIGCWQLLSRALEDGSVSEGELSALRGKKVVPDSKHVLSPPEWIFFEDRAGLKAKFKVLENNVIPRPQGAWSAMEASGVRILSKAASSHLVECDEPCTDELVSRRIRERRSQLVRVLEGHFSGTYSKLSLLDQLQCLLVEELKIQFSLNAFNRELVSEVESVPTHFKRQEAILYFVSRNGMIPWPSIARELALALCPDVEPGILAPGIKEVLVAETEESAQSILDELGFPPLETGKGGEAPKPGHVSELGGPAAPEGVTPVPPAPEVGQSSEQEGELPLTPEEAVRDILGEGAARPTPMPKELIQLEPGRGRQGKLRTYVTADGRDHGKAEDPKSQEQREAVDQAGVNRVVEYERNAGRLPKVMPPKHPGYDIESSDSTGAVVRYIEVKSLSGDWGSLGAPVTRRQFKKAEEVGDRYWLYVVERAETDDFRIHRIQNPANLANQFIYDDGWRVLAEDDIPAAT